MLTNHNEDEHLKEKAEAFDAQQGVMEEIGKIRFEKYAETLPNLPEAFDRADGRCSCMDGRIKVGKVRLPGSGIDTPRAELIKSLKDAGVKSVTWHPGCGAAAKKAVEMGFSANDADTVAQKFSEGVADELGIPCIKLEVEGNHKERVCYCAKNCEFNPDGIEGLPNGFVVNDLDGISKESFLKAVELSLSIAFGDHGFGALFTEENPFVLVAIAKTQEELEETKAELMGVVNNFGKKVHIDGFVAPKAALKAEAADEELDAAAQ